MALLEVRNIVKRYSGIPAIQDVSFCIEAGEILGYLGPNGAGKSTTVKILTGLTKPTSGQTLYCGEDIHAHIDDYKQQYGYVPEEPNLYGYMSGGEYLDLVVTLRGLPKRQAERKVGKLLNLFQLYEHRDVLLSSYSKGMRQRILLIGALIHDPKLVIFDEPFSGLDVASTFVLRELIGLLAESGKAIFFSSHLLEIVEKVCTKIVVLNRGRIAATGSISELCSSGQVNLEETFLRMTEQFDANNTAEEILNTIQSR